MRGTTVDITFHVPIRLIFIVFTNCAGWSTCAIDRLINGAWSAANNELTTVKVKSKNIQNIQLKNSGEYMKAAPFDKSGIYFIEFDNTNEMEHKTEYLKDYIKIDSLKVQYE